MSSQKSILDLPTEIFEMIFQRISATKDVENCSIVLAGTRHEKFVMEHFLKPQLNIFASLDVNLNKSMKNMGWFQECQDIRLIARLWKKLKPLKGIIYSWIMSGTSHYILQFFKCFIKCRFLL